MDGDRVSWSHAALPDLVTATSVAPTAATICMASMATSRAIQSRQYSTVLRVGHASHPRAPSRAALALIC